ncbi:MAG: hypothetical protein LBK47_09870 [Prevotellaceae bacterium]|nr:hypothetical protein [Prevotellaceae bacterium]
MRLASPSSGSSTPLREPAPSEVEGVGMTRQRFLHSASRACPERSRGGRNAEAEVPPLRFAPVGMTGRR